MNVDPLAKRNASYSSCYDVCKYISELGISKVNSGLRPLQMFFGAATSLAKEHLFKRLGK